MSERHDGRELDRFETYAMPASRTRFYLNRRDGRWKGVCAGLEDYTGIEAIWWRIGAVVSMFLMPPMPLIAYLVMAWSANDRPAGQYEESREVQKFWQGVRVAPGRSIRDVHSRFRDLDRRLGHVERHYTAQNTRLAAEIDNLK
jgi:phage shock protein C